MKKAPPASRSSTSTGRRRSRRAIEYALLLIGLVVFVDALVGEKGLLETVKKRQEFKVLEQSIRRARAERTVRLSFLATVSIRSESASSNDPT